MHGRLLLLLALASNALATTVPGEWIAIRAPESRASWTAYRTFGPDGRFALLRDGEDAPPEATYLQPNFVYRGLGADPDLARSWALPAIGAPQAWSLFDGGGSTVVAVIDTGIDESHEDLRGALWSDPQTGAHGWNVLEGNAVTADDNGHGTFCAGIIGAEAGNGHGSRGVSRARLMAVKSFDKRFYGTTTDQITAIHWAVSHGARLLNASWGGTGYDQALYDTIRWAGQQGALVVAAAGNDAVDNDGKENPTYPAAFRLPNLIAVAAVDDRDRLAAFSNYGKETVQLAAPGVAIYSPSLGGYRIDEGTSFAAAHVSGVAALLSDYLPALSAVALRERLLATSEVIGYYEKERLATAGRVHAYNALAGIRPPRPHAPELWRRTPQSRASSHPYANGADQSFEIVRPGAKNVRVHFARLRTEAGCDHVTLTDGAGRTVFAYSGDRGEFTSADALGDRLVIRFQSDAVGTDWGFEIDYDEAAY